MANDRKTFVALPQLLSWRRREGQPEKERLWQAHRICSHGAATAHAGCRQESDRLPAFASDGSHPGEPIHTC